MAFLAASPISVIRPICAYTLLEIPGRNDSVNIAPNAPMGTASNTENGTDQLSYSAARKRNTNVMEKTKI